MSPADPLHVGLLTCDLSHRHGWARYSLNLAQALNRAGVRLTVIASADSPDVPGVTVHRLLPSVTAPERGLVLRLLLALPRTRARLSDCDIIHTTVEPFAPLAFWAAGRRPLVITGHGSYVRLPVERRPPVSTLYRRAFLRSALVCVSHYTERVARDALPGLRTAVIANGVDATRFDGLVRARDSDRPTLLAVGAVKARKGILELVQAAAEVRRQLPALRCVIIGSLSAEPAYVERVRAAVAALDLADCVTLTGTVPESALLRWYGAADVFVLPAINAGGRFEGYGLAYLEASAAGLPVIGTTECGAEDAVDDGQTGLLVPQGQIAAALPVAILRLLNDPPLRDRLGAAGRAKAAGRTWDVVAADLLALYNRVKGMR